MTGSYNEHAEAARNMQDEGKPCTLDGRPARIGGFALKFGLVRSLDGKMSGEWAWESIIHVMKRNGGKFTL